MTRGKREPFARRAKRNILRLATPCQSHFRLIFPRKPIIPSLRFSLRLTADLIVKRRTALTTSHEQLAAAEGMRAAAKTRLSAYLDWKANVKIKNYAPAVPSVEDLHSSHHVVAILSLSLSLTITQTPDSRPRPQTLRLLGFHLHSSSPTQTPDPRLQSQSLRVSSHFRCTAMAPSHLPRHPLSRTLDPRSPPPFSLPSKLSI